MAAATATATVVSGDVMMAGGTGWRQCIAGAGESMRNGGGGISRRRGNRGGVLQVRCVQAAERQGGSNGVAMKPKPKNKEEEDGVKQSPKPASSPSPWSLGSWRRRGKKEKLGEMEEAMGDYPPLVFAGEVRHLEEKIGEAALGRSFLLHGGDCSTDIFSSTDIRDTFRILLQMAVVLMFGGQMPVVKVGRLAGYFGSAESKEFRAENGDNQQATNGHASSGEPAFDSELMMRAYSQSAAALNLLRSFATGGYAAMQRVTKWNLDFTANSDQGYRYLELARRVNEALGFMSALGVTIDHPIMRVTDFWTSQECVSLPYEEALTRRDSTTGQWYDCSTHMLWMDERTCQLNGEHLEFLRGIENPLGIKVSDKMDPSELVRVCEILNPENRPGRLTIITHMGAEKLRQKLPQLIRAINQVGLIVTWVTDPMHGYAVNASSSLSTHCFQDILDEVQAFFDVHEEEGSHAGGIHLEMTAQNVSECESDGKGNGRPRLNASQSLELAFIIASRLRKHRAHLHNHLLPI